jgi:NTE family protein
VRASPIGWHSRKGECGVKCSDGVQGRVDRRTARKCQQQPLSRWRSAWLEATAPLPESGRVSVVSNSDALPASPVDVVQAAAEFQWDGNRFETGIGIAASGGGFRAMLFHVGALVRLNELGLLTQAKRISSVSGGSIATGYLASAWEKLKQANFSNFKQIYVEPIIAFSRLKIDVVNALTGVLPWTSAAEEVADSYDKHLFHGWTLQQLPDEPRFVFCATNLQTGVLWRFSKPYAGDYVVGRLDKPQLRLAQAVAASSAFPPVLSPLSLKLPDGSFSDWPGSRASVTVGEIERFRARVLLTDGGVYDNHGIEPLVKRYATVFVSDGGAPFGRTAELDTDWISQLRRILDVTDNQVRALRRRDLIDRLIEGNEVANEAQLVNRQAHGRMGAYWGIDTDPGKVAPAGALPCDPAMTHKLAQLPTRLSDLGDLISQQLVNWGYAVCDRSIRANYKGQLAQTPAAWPYPEAPVS